MNELEVLRGLGTELDPPTDTLPPGLRYRALTPRPAHRPRRGMRRLAVVGALAAVAVATVVSLAFALPRAPATNGGPTAEVHVHLAAWSVDTNPDKTVTLTFRELSDPQKLSEILAEAGVRAKVQFVQIPEGKPVIGCYKQGPRALRDDKVISGPRDVDGAKEFIITPAAMPRGSVLSFVVFLQSSGEHGTVSDSDVWEGTAIMLFDGEPDPCVLIPPAVAASGGP